jgi:glycosyltransferase involved in cell wall biosynthesis
VKISVITVAWNAAATIADTCASVAAQDWPEIEHIIIDGGSNDATAAIVAANAAAGHVFVSERDHGLYDAMNKGLARATGDVIGFLNADDFLCRTDAIRLIAAEALADPAADAISAAVAIVAANDPERLTRAYPPTPFAPWMLRLAHMPPHPGFYARRRAFDHVGGFDPAIRIGADFDWMVRFFAKHRLSSRPLAETLVTLREGGLSNQGFASRKTINREALATLRRHRLLALAPLVWAKYPVKALQFVVPPVDWPAPKAVRFRSRQHLAAQNQMR